MNTLNTIKIDLKTYLRIIKNLMYKYLFPNLVMKVLKKMV